MDKKRVVKDSPKLYPTIKLYKKVRIPKSVRNQNLGEINRKFALKQINKKVNERYRANSLAITQKLGKFNNL